MPVLILFARNENAVNTRLNHFVLKISRAKNNVQKSQKNQCKQIKTP